MVTTTEATHCYGSNRYEAMNARRDGEERAENGFPKTSISLWRSYSWSGCLWVDLSVFYVRVLFRSACRLPAKCECAFYGTNYIIFENFLPSEVNFNYSYILFRFLSSSQSSDTNARAAVATASAYAPTVTVVVCCCFLTFFFCITSFRTVRTSKIHIRPSFIGRSIGTRYIRVRNAWSMC